MTKIEFEKLLDKLKENSNSDYWIDLSYRGIDSGVIYGDGKLDSINIEERFDCVLIHNGTLGILADDANLYNI